MFFRSRGNLRWLCGLTAWFVSEMITASAQVTGLPPGRATVEGEADTVTMNQVIVRGHRASLEAATERKRTANAIVDVISEEDIGQFPDSNIAESLSHLPGVAVDRQFGAGEKVSILGTDPALNRVLINGQTIASGDWGGNPTDVSGRTFNATLLSPEIIGFAEVYKGSEARLPEGSIGGTINLNTRRPLDLPADSFRASVGYSYNDRSEQGNARGSLLYSWKSRDNRVGALITLTHDRDELHRAGIEYWGFATSAAAGGATVPFGINSAFFQQVRERQGAQAALQWKPTDQLELNLTLLGVRGRYNNFSQSRYVVPPVWGVLDRFTLSNGYVVAGHVANVNGAAETVDTLQFDTFYRQTGVGTSAIDLRADWRDGGRTVSAQIGHTRAYGGRDPEYLMSFNYSGGYSFAYDGQNATLSFDDRGAATDPTKVVRRAADVAGSLWYVKSDDHENYVQLDTAIPAAAGPVKMLHLGTRFSRHENSDDSWSYHAGAPQTVSLADFSPRLIPGHLFDGLPVGGDLTQWMTASKDAIVSYLTARPFVAKIDEPSWDFDVKEDIAAAYAQADFAKDNLRGNAGIRFVSTRDESRFWTYDAVASTYAREIKRRTYNRILPSVNLTWDLAANRLLRIGAARAIARPRYQQLAGQISRNDQNLTGSGGNPDLKSYESSNLNVAFEVYQGRAGLVAAELFLRDIRSYVLEVTQEKMLLNPRTGQNAVYTITSPFNAGQARVRGASLAIQRSIAGGFGLQANYTFAEVSTTNGYNLPYLSKHSYNLTPYFEHGRWGARLNYNWRSEFFTSIGRLNTPLFADAYRQLDASVSVRVNRWLRLTFEATNLLDSTYYWYYRVKYAPMGVYKNGRMFTVNAAVNF